MAFCEHCLCEVPDGDVLCAECAAAAHLSVTGEEGAREAIAEVSTEAPQFRPQFTAAVPVTTTEEKHFLVPLTQKQLPVTLKTLGTWAYVGYMLLFLIPVVGWIISLVLACGATRNINLRNLARATLITGVMLVVLLAVAGGLLWYFEVPLPQVTVTGWTPY